MKVTAKELSHRLFIDFQYQSIDKYRLVLIDTEFRSHLSLLRH